MIVFFWLLFWPKDDVGKVGVDGGDEQQARLSLVDLPVEVGGDLQWSRLSWMQFLDHKVLI